MLGKNLAGPRRMQFVMSGLATLGIAAQPQEGLGTALGSAGSQYEH
jgi:hypothetical protein